MDSVGAVVEKVDLEPRMHMIADLSSEKFNLHLSQCSVELYEFPRFSARVHNGSNAAHASCSRKHQWGEGAMFHFPHPLFIRPLLLQLVLSVALG